MLDVRQDRYFLVPAAVADVTERWLRARGAPEVPPEVSRLFSHSGISRRADPPPRPIEQKTLGVPHTLAAAENTRSSALLSDATRIAAIIGETWLELRLRPLQRILARRHRRHLAGSAAQEARLVGGAARYEAARKFCPIARNCLLDSLALDAWLGRNGDRRLVFGVTGQPFAAHCWLQTGQSILNDSYERVSRYAPILVI